MNLVIKTCKYCQETFLMEHGSFANHVKYCKKNPAYNYEKIRACCIKASTIGNERRFGKTKRFEVKCSKCGKKFFVKEREKLSPKKSKYFCSIPCANSRVHSKETKKIISTKIKEIWKDENYAKKVIKSNCSKNPYFTSKGEREVRDYFITNFPNDEWTFGSLIRFNNVPIVRDLYSNRLKVCIEYDGIWHFDNFHGQLTDKHKQDIALEEWCKLNNYRLIRIDDELYSKNKKFWLQKVINAVYKSKDQIIKFWDEKSLKILKENLKVLKIRNHNSLP